MINLCDVVGGADSNPFLAEYFCACAKLTAKSFQTGPVGAGVGGRRCSELGRYCRMASPVGVAGFLPLTFTPTQ